MSNDKTTKAAPTHRIYSVSKFGDKTNWTEIGAAWPHKDKKGFNLSFTARPLEGAEIVLREPLPKEDSDKPKAKVKSSRRTKGRNNELTNAGDSAQ